MGTFWGSIHIRTEDVIGVKAALERVALEANAKFLVGPELDGWISAFPNNAGQDDQISAKIANILPKDIFHLIVHDDSIFSYHFYRDGRLIDRYNSCPEYFGEVSDAEKEQLRGNPDFFRDLLPEPGSADRIKSLIAPARGPQFTFEYERMTQFAKILGLSNALGSYESLQAGERDGIKGWKKFFHVPDTAAEKSAKRAAKALLTAEKKRLRKEGVLLAELKAPSQKGQLFPKSISWGTDSANNGVLVLWQSFGFSHPNGISRDAADLLVIHPPWNDPLAPSGITVNATAAVFCTSSSAKWLAGGFVAGDWKLRVWDWARREFAFEVNHTQAVQWVAFSQDEDWVYSLSGEEFTVSSLRDKRAVTEIPVAGGARNATVHPSGKFVVITTQNHLIISEVKERATIKKLKVNRRTEAIGRFLNLSDESIAQIVLRAERVRKRIGVEPGQYEAILKDPAAIGELSAKIQTELQSRVEALRSFSQETIEGPWDVAFDPSGERLFLSTTKGTHVFDWNKMLGANEDTSAPELSTEAPPAEDDLGVSYAYSVRFDAQRKILLSSCSAGVIQFLNIVDGRAGTLLKLPDEAMVTRIEITSDRSALCCHCFPQPRIDDRVSGASFLQIWNYPALCKAAGLD